jgi:hypothetical protein
MILAALLTIAFADILFNEQTHQAKHISKLFQQCPEIATLTIFDLTLQFYLIRRVQ